MQERPAEDGGKPVLYMKLKYLPVLLDDFEKLHGAQIIRSDQRTNVDHFADAHKEDTINVNGLVESVVQLLGNFIEAGSKLISDRGVDDAEVSGESQQDDLSRSVNIARSIDVKQVEDFIFTRAVQIGEPSPARRRPLDFPRSQSEQQNVSVDKDEVRRKLSFSDPSTPVLQRPLPYVHTIDESQPVRRQRRRNESYDDRPVLKGKGTAKSPPSSWTKPKPQALAQKDRDLSGSEMSVKGSSHDDDYEHNDSDRILTVSPTASATAATLFENSAAPRRRLSSQPSTASNVQVPRSASSSSQPGGFVFPRASSPPDVDVLQASASERWHMLAEKGSSASRSQGAISPTLDELSYYAFDAISPTSGGDHYPRARSAAGRRSSGTTRKQIDDQSFGDEGISYSEQISSLEAQMEALQRALLEKDRSTEQVQRQSEEYVAGLQEHLDKVQADLSLRRKEDALNKIREHNHLDTIADLEAELTRANGELDTLRAQHARLRSDYDELVQAMELQAARNMEHRQEVEKARAEIEAFVESEQQWDVDREGYRATIKKLNDHIADLQQKLLGREEDQRIITSLKSNVESLMAELKEMRYSGSGVLNVPGKESDASLSKRLGSELARSLREGSQLLATGAEKEDDNRGDEGEQDDDDSVIVIHRRKRRSQVDNSTRLPVEITEAGMQTVAAEADAVESTTTSAEIQNREPLAPPTYDEAKLEKAFSLRLHPAWSSADVRLPNVQGSAVQSYQAVAQRIGTRCLHFEEQLKQDTDAANLEDEKPSLMTNILATGKAIFKQPRSAISEVVNFCSSVQKQDLLPCRGFFFFLGGLLLGLAMLVLLAPDNPYMEDPEAWYISNTLQVPWSGVERYDAARWASVMGADHRSWLLRRLAGPARLAQVIPT